MVPGEIENPRFGAPRCSPPPQNQSTPVPERSSVRGTEARFTAGRKLPFPDPLTPRGLIDEKGRTDVRTLFRYL